MSFMGQGLLQARQGLLQARQGLLLVGQGRGRRGDIWPPGQHPLFVLGSPEPGKAT